ncbi:MAG: tetratricopeptide repeat protein [Nannocystaceae bacterium]
MPTPRRRPRPRSTTAAARADRAHGRRDRPGPGHFDQAASVLVAAYHRAGQPAPTSSRPLRPRAWSGSASWVSSTAPRPGPATHACGLSAQAIWEACASRICSRPSRACRTSAATSRFLATAESALALTRAAVGEQHPDVAISTATVGAQAGMAGDVTRARVELERALALGEPLLGEHPDVAIWIANLGQLAEQRGALDEALALHRRALQILEHTAGPDSPTVAGVEDNVGRVHYLRGELDEAERHHQRALTIRERIGNDGDLAYSYNNLATIALQRGQPEHAVTQMRRAVAAMQRTSPGDHPVTAALLAGLALSLGRSGHHDEAIATTDDAVAMAGRAGRAHRGRAPARPRGHGAAGGRAPARGDRALPGRDGAALARRCVGDGDLDALQGSRAPTGTGRLGRPPTRPSARARDPVATRRSLAQRAQLELLLARALWDADRDRVRAVKLSRAASLSATTVAPLPTRRSREAAAWLASHDR